nr:MAG TPA: hypothetical protein [Caudoviricetes sp.]
MVVHAFHDFVYSITASTANSLSVLLQDCIFSPPFASILPCWLGRSSGRRGKASKLMGRPA